MIVRGANKLDNFNSRSERLYTESDFKNIVNMSVNITISNDIYNVLHIDDLDNDTKNIIEKYRILTYVNTTNGEYYYYYYNSIDGINILKKIYILHKNVIIGEYNKKKYAYIMNANISSDFTIIYKLNGELYISPDTVSDIYDDWNPQYIDRYIYNKNAVNYIVNLLIIRRLICRFIDRKLYLQLIVAPAWNCHFWGSLKKL